MRSFGPILQACQELSLAVLFFLSVMTLIELKCQLVKLTRLSPLVITALPAAAYPLNTDVAAPHVVA